MKKLATILLCLICLAGCASKKDVITRDVSENLSVLQSGASNDFIKNAVVEYENNELFDFRSPKDTTRIFYSINSDVLAIEAVDPDTALVNMNITAIDITGLRQDTYNNLYNAAVLEYLNNTEALNIEEELPTLVDGMASSIIDTVQQWTEEDIRGAINDEILPSVGAIAKGSFIDKELEKLSSTIESKLKAGNMVPFRITNLNVKVKKVDGIWKLCIDEPFYKALIGYSDSEDYETIMHGEFIAFKTPEHSWVQQTAATKPGEILTHWKPNSSFYFNVIFAVALIFACVYFLVFKKGRVSQ